MLKTSTILVFLLLFASRSAFADLREEILQKAQAGWEKIAKLHVAEGTWTTRWQEPNGIEIEIGLGRLGDKLIVTDQRKTRLDGADVKSTNLDEVQFTIEKAWSEKQWRLRTSGKAVANEIATRTYQATLWESFPYAINGTPLKTIFADPDTKVTKFSPVEDQPGFYTIEFEMTHGVVSNIAGASIMKDMTPFFFYPAKCAMVVDSKRDWRVNQVDYHRKMKGKPDVFDHVVVEYKSDLRFTVSSQQGESEQAAKEKTPKVFSVSYEKQPPSADAFELKTYGL